MASKAFTFICGPDDFLVTRLGKEHYEALSAEVEDEFSQEIISGFVNNVADVEAAVNRFREAVQTLGLFGGKRVVWLKDINFLADTVTGRAEGTLTQVGELKTVLESIVAEEVGVVITASPIDRRRSFPKWCEANSHFELVGDTGRNSGNNWHALAEEECRKLEISISANALELLHAKINGNTRLFFEELNKLAAYLGEAGAVIEEKHVEELVPTFGEGDFFEAAEAFFSRKITWTLDALKRHFFAGNDARGLLSALQNRNRLLIQIRGLVDAGDIRLGGRGFEKSSFEAAAQRYGEFFGEATTKSAYHIFTQNLWYLGKLASGSALPTLRKLIDHQKEFVRAFEEILERPSDQEAIMTAMAVRCLT